MRKDSYRIIFEGAFDNYLLDAIRLSKCTWDEIRPFTNAVQHAGLYRMAIMAYEMDIISYDEECYLRDAIEAIFREV